MIISAVTAIYLYSPIEWIGLLLLLLTFLGQYETCALLAAAGMPTYSRASQFFGVLLVGSAWLYLCGILPALTALAIPTLLLLLLLAATLRGIPSAERLRRLMATLSSQLYVPFCIIFLGLILNGWGGVDGRKLTIFFVAMVKATDIGAYFVGSAIGRHKLIPHISPGKTWEGSGGGVLGAYIAGAAFYFSCGGAIGPFQMHGMDLAVLPILMALSGSIGDLVESMFKRSAKMQDSSSMIAGMGGTLDVIDSLLFSAPVFYIYVMARISAQTGEAMLTWLRP